MGFLTREPIGIDALITMVMAPERGGVATFLGVVRNHHGGYSVTGLDYNAYQPMAEAVCAELIAEAESMWRVRAALCHRVGHLEVGDVAVAIAVAGHHRDEAFAACRHLIEELKRRVPIWKRETYSDGTEAWVDPTTRGAGSREQGAVAPE